MKKILFLLLSFFATAMGAESHPRTEIDILVAFDKNAAKAIHGSPDECAQRAVNNLQQAIVRSKLSDRIHFNLAGVIVLEDYESQVVVLRQRIKRDVRLNHEDKEELFEKAEHIGYGRDYQNVIAGRIPGLEEKRKEVHADIVLLALDYNVRSLYGMGHGYSLVDEIFWDDSNKTSVLSSPHMLSKVNYVGCFHHVALATTCSGTDVFVHETMHLLGCGHSDRHIAEAGPGPFYYTNSNAFFTEDYRYGTIMCYPWKNAHRQGSVPHVQGDTHPLSCLSGPYRPYLSGADARLPELPEQFGDEERNNRLVALLNAGIISTYELSGRERLINDDRSAALPLPPMVESKQWVQNFSEMMEIPAEKLAELLNLSIPGFTREGALTTVIIGTNITAVQNEEEALPGGSGKTVWYRVKPQAAGALRIGVRVDATESGLAPVVELFNADGTPYTTRNAVPREEATGYYHCLDAQVSRNRELYIAVDTGNQKGGQFSLVAQLVPSAEQPSDEPETITEETETEEPEPEGTDPVTTTENTATVNTDTSAGAPAKEWSDLDMMLLFIAGISTGTSFMLLLMLLFGRKQQPTDREPWRPTERKESPDAPVAPVNPALSNIHLTGKLYNGKSVEYSFPISRMLREGELKLGHHENCGICISDETVSGYHASLKFVPSPTQNGKADLNIKDLNSTNGTWVNGRKLTPGEQVKLHHGEKIQLGLAVFTLHIQ